MGLCGGFVGPIIPFSLINEIVNTDELTRRTRLGRERNESVHSSTGSGRLHGSPSWPITHPLGRVGSFFSRVGPPSLVNSVGPARPPSVTGEGRPCRSPSEEALKICSYDNGSTGEYKIT